MLNKILDFVSYHCRDNLENLVGTWQTRPNIFRRADARLVACGNFRTHGDVV